jgi:ABC-type transport system involved in multi-copper enzyme maturation permease subunit
LLGPIFVREWLTVPRRASHYIVRSAYLGFLWVLGLTAWQAIVGWSQPATLGDNSRFGLLLFQILTIVQFAFLVFFAALSAASAITQEKDRRTFVLLLMTDLRSYEIVLGKLFGSLLQIAILLVGMMPVLALIMLLGGVSLLQVFQVGLVLAATALAAGSVGSLVALWRDRTFQALALTVLLLVLYWCLVQAVGVLPAPLSGAKTWLDPYQALQSVLEPPLTGAAVVPPAYSFSLAMVIFSLLLNAWGIRKLRVWNPSGEPIIQREAAEAEKEERDRLKAHAAPGAVRRVWPNPILWREIRTRAYGTRPLLVKAAYALVVGLICYYAISSLWTTQSQSPFVVAEGLVPVAILSLLLVSSQAVTAITSERDIGALDLLLVTDLTPQEFIFGKLWGILYNAKEFLVPPLLLAAAYAWFGYLATPRNFHQELYAQAQSRNQESGVSNPGSGFRSSLGFGELRRQAILGRTGLTPRNSAHSAASHVTAEDAELRGGDDAFFTRDWAFKNAEAYFYLTGATLVLLAFAIVLGVHVALRTANTRLAVIHTLGTVFFLSVGTIVCIYLILINGRFEYQWTSFILFIAAGVGGLWWVLSGDRPSAALTLASWCCPLAVFYTVTNIMVAKPGSEESTDPLMPFLVTAGAFGFTVAAMLVPLLSEFDVALGRTTAGGE